MLSSAEGKELISGLEETARSLATDFGDLDDDDAGQCPESDEWSIREGQDWSVKQLFAHVAEIESGLVDEALEIAARPAATIGRPPGALWGEAQRAANDRTLRDILEQCQSVHRATLERVKALSDDDLPKKGTHLGSGPATVLSSLTVVVGHRRMHIFQARSNLLSLRARRDGRVPTEAYSVRGDSGPWLLLIDGNTSRWDAVASELGSSGYRVVQYRFVAQSADIERLRAELGIGDLWIAGAAGGAVDACKYAVVHGDRLAGLVMANMGILPFYRDRPDDLSAVRMPALTLIGENYVQRDRVRERAAGFSNGSVLVMAGVGRDIPGEQPAAVIGAIRDFVRAHTRA